MTNVLRQLIFGLLLFGALQALGDPLDRIPRPPSNGEQVPPHLRIRFVPEYERHLDRVVLTVGSSSSSVGPVEARRIIAALPTYTQISLFSHHPAILPKGDVLSIFGPSSKLRIFHNLTHPWTQDLGEGTAERFLLGMKGILHRVPLQNLDIPMEEHFLPLDGGNVQLARNREGEKIVFLGGSEFRETEGFMVAAGITNANAHTRRMYRETFDADKVVVLPNWEAEHIDQSVLLVGDGQAVTEALPEMSADEFWLVLQYQSKLAGIAHHGDNVRVPLYAPDYEGTTRILSPRQRDRRSRPTEQVPSQWMSPAQVLLFVKYRTEVPHFNDLLLNWRHTEQRHRTEALLEANGFKITRLKTTIWHQLNCMHFVNAMPFRNRETGETELLFPVYHLPGDSPDDFNPTRLRKQNRDNVITLESIGLGVRPVQSVFGTGGNLHCMIYQF